MKKEKLFNANKSKIVNTFEKERENRDYNMKKLKEIMRERL